MIYVAFLDDGHGMETAGKRTPYIKSLGRSIKENEFNAPVVKMLGEELKRHGVQVYYTAPTDEDIPLKQRTDFVNSKYDELCRKYGKANVNAIFVSIHYNAFDSKFDGAGKDPEGFEVIVYLGNKKYKSGKLAESILKYLKQGTRQVNRGVKEMNLHVVRETKIPAVLTENGFMDNEREALLMIDKNFQREVALEHAKGILEYFGIKYKEEVKNVSKPVSNKKDYEGHAYEKEIKFVMEKGWFKGYPDGNFGVNDPITRGQFALVLKRLYEQGRLGN